MTFKYHQVIQKIQVLPRDRIQEVIAFVDFIGF